MEELIKMLIDEGAIRVAADRWSADPARLDATRVPQTLTGVLQARLDGLKPAEKLALQQASVIGHVFWDQALAAIDSAAPQTLPALAQRELAIPHPDTSLDGIREFAFKHQILHHVVYDTVLKPMRRTCHALVAAWLAGLRGARTNDFLGAIAEHFDKAGDADQACEFFTRAAEHAKQRDAHEAALGYVARAFALLDAAPAGAAPGVPQHHAQLRWRLLDVRERIHDLRGERDEQRADIEALTQVAQALDDTARRATAASRNANFAMRLGDYATQAICARQALQLATQAGVPELRLRAQRQLASALGYLGDVAAGKALAEEGLASARAAGLRQLEPLYLNTLSVIASMQDDQLRRLELLQQLLPIDRELGNRRDEAVNLGNLGAALLSLGEVAQAQSAFGRGAANCPCDRRPPQPTLYPVDAVRTRAHSRQRRAGTQSRAGGGRTRARRAQRRNRGDRAVHLGQRRTRARPITTPRFATFEEARQTALAIGDALQFDAWAGMARALLAQDQVAAALHIVEQLLIQMHTPQALEGAGGPRLIEWSCCQVLMRAGDARAAQVLAHSHTQLQAKAAAISNPAMRRSFLTQVAEHREIVAAWQALR